MEELNKFGRRRDIKLSIPPYRESLPTSCGSACIMMIMAYYLNTPLNTQIENDIHENVKFSSYDVENGAKMIRYLRKHGFDVVYFINAERDFFENHPIEGLPPDIWHSMVEEFFSILEEERKSGLKIIEDTTIENIVRNIEQKNPIICEIQLDGYITHSIVVRGISSNRKVLYILDPLSRNVYMHIPINELDRMMNITYGTPRIYGRNFLIVKYKKK